MNPVSPVPELVLAGILGEDGHLDRAAAIYRSLAERFVGDAEVQAAIGAFELDHGDAAIAASHFAAALALAPDHGLAQHNLGIVCARLGLLEVAERNLRRRGEAAHDALANVLFEQGRFDEAAALADLEDFIRAARAVETEDWHTALGALARSHAMRPHDAANMRHLGIALDAAGQPAQHAFAHAAVLGDDAAARWTRLLESKPDDRERLVRVASMESLGRIAARCEPNSALVRVETCAFHSDQWHVECDGRLSADLALVWPEGPRRLLDPIAHNGHALIKRAPPGRSFQRAILWGGSDNFYHWLIDDLPRLPALLTAPPDLPVVFHGPLNAFQKDSLAHLGFDTGRLALLSGIERHETSELYVPVATDLPRRADQRPDREAMPVPRAVLDWLRRSFGPWRAGAGSIRRLFVSRRGARFRRLTNEAEVEALLIDRGFAVIEAEHLSLREQIALFSGAEIVIGVHGAGLTNMVFAPEGAVLIELHPPGQLPPYFKGITQGLGMRHFVLSGRAVRALHPLKRSFWHFRVDPEALAALIAPML